MSTASKQLAFLFCAFTIVELALLPSLARFDAGFARWLDAHRSCRLDYVMFVVKDRPLFLLEVVGGFTLILLCCWGRWREAWHLLLVVLGGGFLCELLKTGLERPRPSVLSEVVAGNSFPSGHVTTALLIAGALGRLLLQEKIAWWQRVVGVGALSVLVGLTTWQRLYLGVHWLTDIVGSMFVVGAWLCFVLPYPHVFVPLRRLLALSACLLASYVFFYRFPELRLVLPSALSVVDEPVVTVAFGEHGARSMLSGEWGEDFVEPPSTWMTRGDASVDVILPEHRTYVLMFAARPWLQSKAFACFPLEVSVNQQRAGVLFLYRGWREYTLVLDARWVKPGVNTLTFHVGAEFPEYQEGQRTVAFQYIRVFVGKE